MEECILVCTIDGLEGGLVGCVLHMYLTSVIIIECAIKRTHLIVVMVIPLIRHIRFSEDGASDTLNVTRIISAATRIMALIVRTRTIIRTGTNRGCTALKMTSNTYLAKVILHTLVQDLDGDVDNGAGRL